MFTESALFTFSVFRHFDASVFTVVGGSAAAANINSDPHPKAPDTARGYSRCQHSKTLYRLFLKLFIFAAFVFPSFLVAADGIFQGRVVDPPANEAAKRGWIFVQGRNQLVRRVEAAHAMVLLPVSAKSGQKRRCNSECIVPGQEVRVTATQDSAGEWRAKKVEILKLAPGQTVPFAAISTLPDVRQVRLGKAYHWMPPELLD